MELREGMSNPRLVETLEGVFTLCVDVSENKDNTWTEEDRLYLVEKGREYIKEHLGYEPVQVPNKFVIKTDVNEDGSVV